ncbi:MAG: M56 family metallopeptidase [Planctomycetaceae bacterium]|nr:M56 family metallopeptidase [Planctomycetaceae bacterium]
MNSFAGFAWGWAEWAMTAGWQFTIVVAIVAILCLGLRYASPRLRHSLWVLALLKLLLPTSLWLPWSLVNWPIMSTIAAVPSFEVLERQMRPSASMLPILGGSQQAGIDRGQSNEVAPTQSGSGRWVMGLMSVWAIVALAYWGVSAWSYRRLLRDVARMPSIDEGPLRIEFERLVQLLELTCVADLHVTDQVSSPFLLGAWSPRIVIPKAMIDELSSDELSVVLAHELMHWRRRDTWIGFLQVLVQGLFWWHPLVWWAAAQLQHERESACDDAVVRSGTVLPQQYGEVMLRVLTVARGRSSMPGIQVGVFERGSHLQQRLEDVMSFHPNKRRFGWASRGLLLLFSILVLPMAPRAAEPEAALSAQPTADAEQNQEAKQTPWPQLIETEPKTGTTGVDAGLSEIRVTFDRDMGKGMSWTGGPPLFPPVDKSRKAQWIDDRTCVLPVKLKRGEYYRLGINSTSHQNFKSTDGVAAPSSVIAFSTAGSNAATERRAKVPTIVELEPANGATDVDSATIALRVTFDTPMGEGMSWTGGGEDFPQSRGGERAHWSKDGRTCILPVQLNPDHEYHLGLNSVHHINFQSKWGVPIEPVVYSFKTRQE